MLPISQEKQGLPVALTGEEIDFYNACVFRKL